MPWAFSGSRIAIALRRLRARFGMAAPQVAVRTQLPWYWRFPVIVLGMALIFGLTVWTFDFGRQIAGFNRDELEALRVRNAAVEAEIAQLRSHLAAYENDLQIEKATQQELTGKYQSLLEENAGLKEQLAVMQRLTKARK